MRTQKRGGFPFPFAFSLTHGWPLKLLSGCAYRKGNVLDPVFIVLIKMLRLHNGLKTIALLRRLGLKLILENHTKKKY